jgi:hypothetical protein
MTRTKVKRRTATAAGRSFDEGAYDADDADDRDYQPKGTTLKGVGTEMHEILPGVVQGGRNQYTQTAQEAMLWETTSPSVSPGTTKPGPLSLKRVKDLSALVVRNKF